MNNTQIHSDIPVIPLNSSGPLAHHHPWSYYCNNNSYSFADKCKLAINISVTKNIVHSYLHKRYYTVILIILINQMIDHLLQWPRVM